ncbi:MAG: PEP-CTERM sorting domain-containing protein [Verrucomicrobiota bacterium]|jgi:hypothetical protein
MKSTTFIGSLAVLVSGVTATQAAMSTTFSYDFSTGGSPPGTYSITPDVSINPSSATGSDVVNAGSGTGYYSGTFSPELPTDPTLGQNYGTQTGVWDTLNGSLQLSVPQRQAVSTVSYTLTIDLYATGTGFPYSSGLTFSVPNSTLNSSVPISAVTPAGGRWYESVYSWTGLTPSGPLSLSVFGTLNNGLLVDRVQWQILGDLAPVPEPTVVQLAAVGSVILGFAAWRRRQSKG